MGLVVPHTFAKHIPVSLRRRRYHPRKCQGAIELLFGLDDRMRSFPVLSRSHQELPSALMPRQATVLTQAG